jgi:predicted metalloprotease with PDZ domain
VKPRAWLFVLVFFSRLSFPQAPVRYLVSLVDAERHLVQVAVELPPGRDTRELQLPVWNALYQVRDFSQNMNWIRARAEGSTGQSLTLTQLTPSRWKISGAERGARVEYEMVTDSPGSFGAQFNSHHAFFNLAEILIYADGERDQPVEIEFRCLPAQWKIATPLAPNSGAYSAQNYDRLVDSPVEIGTFEESDFTATCGNYRVILDSEVDPRSDSNPSPGKMLNEITPPLRRIVSTASDWMNDCPFQTYMFIFHATDSPGSGGMEHTYSTAIGLNQKDFTGDLDHFTSVTAHEFFHLWNVKRIRPQSLEPIDYSKENYTPALWFCEGVDTAVSEQIRLRAGLVDEPHYLAHLGQAITELENRPAHLTQSVEQSSIAAWLEKYSSYQLPEHSISYYNKGELLGVLLDLAMRDASQDGVSLRDLFRSMNDHYAKTGDFYADTEAVEQSAEMLSHSDLKAFFAKYIRGTDEIPWDDFFAPVGLHVVKTEAVVPDLGFGAVRSFDRPLAVARVRPGSEAERAGLLPDDVIVKINEESAARDFEKQVAALRPGATLRLLIRRNGAQQELHWILGSRKQTLFQLQDAANITSQQKARRAAWLFGGSANHP